jgi:hypothetical protein
MGATTENPCERRMTNDELRSPSMTLPGRAMGAAHNRAIYKSNGAVRLHPHT